MTQSIWLLWSLQKSLQRNTRIRASSIEVEYLLCFEHRISGVSATAICSVLHYFLGAVRLSVRLQLYSGLYFVLFFIGSRFNVFIRLKRR